MLTFIQLIILLFWTSISSADAEKLFHNRDHSDMQILNSHQAELITDKYNAEVKISHIFFPIANCVFVFQHIWNFENVLFSCFSLDMDSLNQSTGRRVNLKIQTLLLMMTS